MSHKGKGDFLEDRSVFWHILTLHSYLLNSTVSNSLLAILSPEKSSWPWKRHPDEVELVQTRLTSARFCLDPGSWPPGVHPRTRPSDDQSSGKCAQTTVINSLNPARGNFALGFCALLGGQWLVPLSEATQETMGAAYVQMNRNSRQCSPRLALSLFHCKISGFTSFLTKQGLQRIFVQKFLPPPH